MTRHLTANPEIPVFHRGALGYPAHKVAPRATDVALYVPLSDALIEEWSFDAHFSAVSFPSVPRRLATEHALDLRAPDGSAPAMVAFVVDVDGPGHVRDPAWWAGEKKKLSALAAQHPLPFAHATRGGYRVIYGVRPHPIPTAFAAAHWSASYLAWIDLLEDEFQISCDLHQSPWTALFRLPRVVRDGKKQTPEVIGDHRNIGVWSVPMVDPSTVTRQPEHDTHAVPDFSAPAESDAEAAVYALARAWPKTGRRLLSLALAGALARSGWPVDAIADFVAAVCECAEPGNADYPKRLRAARSSVGKVESDLAVSGWPSVAAVVGDATVDEVCRLLGVGGLPEVDESFMLSIRGAMNTKRPKYLAPVAAAAHYEPMPSVPTPALMSAFATRAR